MINRRQFLKITGAGASALVTGGITSLVEGSGAGAATKSLVALTFMAFFPWILP